MEFAGGNAAISPSWRSATLSSSAHATLAAQRTEISDSKRERVSGRTSSRMRSPVTHRRGTRGRAPSAQRRVVAARLVTARSIEQTGQVPADEPVERVGRLAPFSERLHARRVSLRPMEGGTKKRNRSATCQL
jgi:hypothetical protein